MTEKCNECGKTVEPLLVTGSINMWDADDEQVDEMGAEYAHLKEDFIETQKFVYVWAHICPECKAIIGNPGIEQA